VQEAGHVAPFLFEFMDQPSLPASLHATLREVLAFHLHVTLGYYYRWAARSALDRAEREHLPLVTELGAGAAGFSQTLAALIRDRGDGVQVEISDLRPDAERYRQLEHAFPDLVHARTEPRDFITTPPESREALVVFSAAFHHIPPADREAAMRTLASRRVMIFESVTRTLPAMLGCAVGFLPALLTPLYFVRTSSGRWRRFLWCWLVPVAPVMVAWDGVVSCLRCWTEAEWRAELRRNGVAESSISFEKRGFSHLIGW
jgi:hypothetical protein